MADIRCVVSLFYSVLIWNQVYTYAAKNSGDLLFLHSPKYLRFEDVAEFNPNEIHKLIASMFGLVTQKDLKWPGLRTLSLLSRPKANILVSIPGYTNQLPPLNLDSVATYHLNDDLPRIDTNQLKEMIESRFVAQDPMIVDLSFDQSVILLQSQQAEIFNELPSTLGKMSVRLMQKDSVIHTLHIGSLNSSKEADLALLSELQLIQDVAMTMKKKRQYTKHKSPDFYVFSITGLQALVDRDGPNSVHVKDAVLLISEFLQNLKSTLIEIYKGNMVMEVVTLASSGSEPHLRVARSLKGLVESNLPHEIGLSPDYGPDYPIIFNIILWLMIGLAIATLFIAHSIWFLDPGRDSIIYRMTSQRMKKDN